MNRSFINYPEASRWYRRIIHLFDFDEDKDRQARNYLFELRKPFNPTNNIREIEQKLILLQPIFFGAGPNLREQLEFLQQDLIQQRKKFYFVTADGAARALDQFGLESDLICSDLDGLSPKSVDYFLSLNCLMAIHAHGDNQTRLVNIKNSLQSAQNIIGTTQIKSKFPIINPGGFTDGDRGIYLCHHLAPLNQIFPLIGYNFGHVIGEFSKEEFTENQPMTEMKHKKMQLCHQLLESLQIKHQRRILFYGLTAKIDKQILELMHIRQK